MEEASPKILISLNIFVSSANINTRLLETTSGRSLTYSCERASSGIEPWGTPEVTGSSFEVARVSWRVGGDPLGRESGINWAACHQSRLGLACGRGVRSWLCRRPSTYRGRWYQPYCCCLKVSQRIQKPQGGCWRTIFQCKSHFGEVKLIDTDGPWCHSTHNAPRLWKLLAIKRWDGNFPRDLLHPLDRCDIGQFPVARKGP